MEIKFYCISRTTVVAISILLHSVRQTYIIIHCSPRRLSLRNEDYATLKRRQQYRGSLLLQRVVRAAVHYGRAYYSLQKKTAAILLTPFSVAQSSLRRLRRAHVQSGTFCCTAAIFGWTSSMTSPVTHMSASRNRTQVFWVKVH